MEEDDNGLLIRAKIAPTTRGKEILSLLKMSPRPAMSGLGVGFRTRKFTANKSGRTLTDLDLVAVSLCTFPSLTARDGNERKGRAGGARRGLEASDPRRFRSKLRTDLRGRTTAGAGELGHPRGPVAQQVWLRASSSNIIEVAADKFS